MASLGDDRLEHIVPFIVERLKHHGQRFGAKSKVPPLIVGFNGVQGCGKSTVVERLQQVLSAKPHSLHIVILSIDDLYLPHDQQILLAKTHPENPLVQHRGQPSTHDVDLGQSILKSLRANQSTELPIYDKSAFDGQGDRVKDKSVKVDASNKSVDLVIFEGWFNGFRALSSEELKLRWQAARESAEKDPGYNGRLGHNTLESVQFVNSELERYDVLTDQFDALIHIDAEDTHYVYDWRLEAEHNLRQRTGSGMTDAQVKTFVDGYYPSYELYTDRLRGGAFPGESGKQLRLVVGKDRKVKEAFEI